MTAVDPDVIRRRDGDTERDEFIQRTVASILEARRKDTPADIAKRSKSAVREILQAVGPDGPSLYPRVLPSSPEGPDDQDDWTRPGGPVGRAAAVIEEFAALLA